MPITLELDESLLAELKAGAEDRKMSTEMFARSAIEAFLQWSAPSDDGGVLAEDRDEISGLLRWQEERVERGRADIQRGAIATSADLDRIRHKYD